MCVYVCTWSAHPSSPPPRRIRDTSFESAATELGNDRHIGTRHHVERYANVAHARVLHVASPEKVSVGDAEGALEVRGQAFQIGIEHRLALVEGQERREGGVQSQHSKTLEADRERRLGVVGKRHY